MDLETNLRILRRNARIGKTIFVAVLLGLLVVFGFAGFQSVTSFFERRTLGSGVMALVLGAAEIYFLWLVGVLTLDTDHQPRVVPYFQEKYFKRKASVESCAAFRGGFNIAADLPQLDALANRLGVPPLSSFGFADDLLKQPVHWHPLADGTRTTTALIDSGTGLRPETLAELQALAAALKKASETQPVFSLLVRYGKDNFISGVEMGKRVGSFWC